MPTPLLTNAAPAEPDLAFVVNKLSPSIGAELLGIDLAADLSDDTISAIRAALLRYRVIFFRDQDLETADHIAFGRRFGELEVHPFTPN